MKKKEKEVEVEAQESAEESQKSVLDLNKILDEKAKTQGIVFQTMQRSNRIRGALSTGVRSIDLISGGGYAPGTFNYIYGPTGSCKSTLLGHTTNEAMKRGLIVSFHDHENSVDPAYWEKMGILLDKVCGFRNKKNEWEVTPSLRYSLGTTAEDTFKFMTLVLRALPDKIIHEERHFLIDPEYEYQRTWTSIKNGLKNEKVREVDDNAPQMMFIIDSLRSMLPEARDADLDKDPIALLARTFGLCFPLVKTLLGRKNCIMVTTNQLTINPMAKFGNPESEPGGSAVAFYPDFKIRLHINRAQSKIEAEPHASGDGLDRYLYGQATILKNKFGPVFRKSEFRLWLDEQGGAGRGIDPVYDIYNCLNMCGKIEESKAPKTKELMVKVLLDGFCEKTFLWTEFKKFMLYSDGGPALTAKVDEMLHDGSAQALYYDAMKNVSGKSEGKGNSGSSDGKAKNEDGAEVTEV